MRELSMDELNHVSGGIEGTEDAQNYGRCPDDGALLVKRNGRIVCPDCDKDYTGKENPVSAESNKGRTSFLVSGGFSANRNRNQIFKA